MLKNSIKKGLASAMLLSVIAAPVMSVGAQSTVVYPEVQQIFVDNVLADGLTYEQWKVLMEGTHNYALTEQGYIDSLWMNNDGKTAYDLFVEDGIANGKTEDEVTISAFIAGQQDRGEVLSYIRWQRELLATYDDIDVSVEAFINGPAQQAYAEFVAANPNLDFPESSFLYELQFNEYFNQTYAEYLVDAQSNLQPITPETYVRNFLPGEVDGKTEYDLWVEAKRAEGELEENLTPTHFVQLQPDYTGERAPIVEREEEPETPEVTEPEVTTPAPSEPETSEVTNPEDEDVKLSPNGQKYDRVEELAFDREVLENDTMDKGVEEVITPGVKGSVYYLGDEEVDRVDPVNELVVIGTGKQVEEESETTEETTESETTESETTQPETTEPETTQPETTEPETTQAPEETTQAPNETRVVIPFQTIQQNNPNLPVGTTRVVQEGQDGYSVNGRIVQAPVNKVIHVGTGQTTTVVPLNAGNGANYENTTTAQPLNAANQNAKLTESGSKSAAGWLLAAFTTLGLGSILIFNKKDTEEA